MTTHPGPRWPPKDYLDLQCQPVEAWLNHADISQEVYDILLVMIGHIRYLERKQQQQHLRIARLEQELEVSHKPLECPQIAPMEIHYQPRNREERS